MGKLFQYERELPLPQRLSLKNGRTVQESINDEYGSLVKACETTKNADFVEVEEDWPPDKQPEVNRVVYSCPEKGMRQRTFMALIDSWLRVLIIGMQNQDNLFHTPKDIPQSVLFPPYIPYSLGSVILTNGSHFWGISMDAKNIQTGFTFYMMEWFHPKKGFKRLIWMIHFKNMQMVIQSANFGISRWMIPLVNW